MKINGLQFDVDLFIVGGTYKITSEYINFDRAICRTAHKAKLEFLVKDENKPDTYNTLVFTPKQVGRLDCCFEQIQDEPIWMFPCNGVITRDLYKYHSILVNGTTAVPYGICGETLHFYDGATTTGGDS